MTTQSKPARSLSDYIATITLARDIATERGKNIVDLPDLLMALALEASETGSTLRSHGAHPTALTTATTAVDSKLLKELGITAPAPVSLPELANYELTDRAQRILSQAKTSSELALALLQEPSGYIEEITAHAGIEHTVLQTALEQLPAPTLSPVADSSTRNCTSASHTVFLPSDTEKVWEFISNPSNLPSWLPSIDSLDVEPGSAGPWLGQSATPPGKFSEFRTRPSRQIQEVTLTAEDAESKHLEFELRFPHEPRFNTQRVSLQLTEDSKGCTCRVITTWIRPHNKELGVLRTLARKPLSLIVKPAVRYFVKGQAIAITAKLRRAFTQKQENQ